MFECLTPIIGLLPIQARSAHKEQRLAESTFRVGDRAGSKQHVMKACLDCELRSILMSFRRWSTLAAACPPRTMRFASL
jgi:hypothetical protein